MISVFDNVDFDLIKELAGPSPYDTARVTKYSDLNYVQSISMNSIGNHGIECGASEVGPDGQLLRKISLRDSTVTFLLFGDKADKTDDYSRASGILYPNPIYREAVVSKGLRDNFEKIKQFIERDNIKKALSKPRVGSYAIASGKTHYQAFFEYMIQEVDPFEDIGEKPTVYDRYKGVLNLKRYSFPAHFMPEVKHILQKFYGITFGKRKINEDQHVYAARAAVHYINKVFFKSTASEVSGIPKPKMNPAWNERKTRDDRGRELNAFKVVPGCLGTESGEYLYEEIYQAISGNDVAQSLNAELQNFAKEYFDYDMPDGIY